MISLPNEIWFAIFDYLPVPVLQLFVRRVSRDWKNLCDYALKLILKKRLEIDVPNDYERLWYFKCVAVDDDILVLKPLYPCMLRFRWSKLTVWPTHYFSNCWTDVRFKNRHGYEYKDLQSITLDPNESSYKIRDVEFKYCVCHQKINSRNYKRLQITEMKVPIKMILTWKGMEKIDLQKSPALWSPEYRKELKDAETNRRIQRKLEEHMCLNGQCGNRNANQCVSRYCLQCCRSSGILCPRHTG